MTKIYPLCILAALLATALLASCKSDSDAEASSSECAVTGMTMATLNRYLPTTASDGTQTITKVTVKGSEYPMSIDHLQSSIYNLDSLPAGTDVSRVAFATFNSTSTAMIRSLLTDQDTVFVQTDSTDCRKERLLTIYAADGVTAHTYKLQVRVHQEWGDTVKWNRVCNAESYIKALDVSRAVCSDGSLYVFGKEGSTPVLLSSPTQLPLQWTRTLLGSTNIDLSSIQVVGTNYYALAEGLVQQSTDGVNWTPLAAEMPEGVTSFNAWAAIGDGTLVAVTGKGFYSLNLNTNTWTKDALENAAMLPTSDICGTVLPTAGDKNLQAAVVVGKRDGEVVVWQRTIDQTGKKQFSWNYMEDGATSGLELLSSTNAATYDGGILLAGKLSDGNLGKLYMSYNKGLTWSEKVVKRPENTNDKTSIAQAQSYVLATDADNFIYIIGGGTGEVWRGRINRLGWTEIQKEFKE